MRYDDLTGRKFGKLRAVAHASSDKTGRAEWRCLCVCGNETVVAATNLKSGRQKSCGCLRKAMIGAATRTHGMRRSAEYSIWCSMKQRCCNPKNHAYADYGARGITMCDKWRESFEAFLRDMGQRPSAFHTIDRIDNDGPYTLDNCHWADRTYQANNQRRSKRLTFNGRSLTVSQWARETGIKVATLSHRIRKGWPLTDALRLPK